MCEGCGPARSHDSAGEHRLPNYPSLVVSHGDQLGMSKMEGKA